MFVGLLNHDKMCSCLLTRVLKP